MGKRQKRELVSGFRYFYLRSNFGSTGDSSGPMGFKLVNRWSPSTLQSMTCGDCTMFFQSFSILPEILVGGGRGRGSPFSVISLAFREALIHWLIRGLRIKLDPPGQPPSLPS